MLVIFLAAGCSLGDNLLSFSITFIGEIIDKKYFDFFLFQKYYNIPHMIKYFPVYAGFICH